MRAADHDPAAKPDGASGSRNLGLRVLSALVLAPLAVASAYTGSWPFALFWVLAALIVLWEWITLVAGAGHILMFSSCGSALAVAAVVEFRTRPITAVMVIGLGVLASLIFAPDRGKLWIAAGIGYAGSLLLAPLFLRFDPDYGMPAIMLLFAVVWTTDVLGFFAGKALGGPKLCPAISPKKTWSGAVAGAVGGLLAAVGLAHLFAATKVGFFSPAAWGLIGFLLSAVAQCGDLFESWVKRRFGAKDASQLIPGHGGVMDRLDGFWAAALAGCLLGILRGGFHNAAFGLLVW